MRGTIKKVDINGEVIKNLAKWKSSHKGELFFDSKFEWEAYTALEKEKFNFTAVPESRVVMEGFHCIALSGGKSSKKLFKSKVRQISYTSDFLVYTNSGKKVYIETKGWWHSDARLRYKLFQASLASDEISLVALQKNKGNKDLKAIIRIIKEEFGGSTKGAKIKKIEPVIIDTI